MKKLLPTQAFRKLTSLYADMQTTYDEHAALLGLRCDNCQQNCCTSFFQHHTYIEWAYLLHGLGTLPPALCTTYQERAQQYVQAAQAALAQGQRPHIMCPLNDDGRCGVYAHRLMICRLHGVPNKLRYPSGQEREFPGCFQSQELCATRDIVPVLDRTALYTRLMELEMGFVGAQLRRRPRVDLTLAEMIVRGVPQF